MKVLVIGGDGMLGHRLLEGLAADHEVRGTLRRDLREYEAFGRFHPGNAVGGVDVRDLGAVRQAMQDFGPDVVINAAGVVKQRGEASEAVPSIEINSLFPHLLAAQCRDAGAPLIHYSTDCVFSGSKGAYRESDIPDPVDLYGRSKLLGEVDAGNCLTLRTSMIGPELSRKTGLIEWFLSQSGRVAGYTRAVFSGLTTEEHVRVVGLVLKSIRNRRLAAHGVFHVAGPPISKYDLLCMVAERLGLDTRIDPVDSVVIDRSLDASRFRAEFGYAPPGWREMVDEMAFTLRSES